MKLIDFRFFDFRSRLMMLSNRLQLAQKIPRTYLLGNKAPKFPDAEEASLRSRSPKKMRLVMLKKSYLRIIKQWLPWVKQLLKMSSLLILMRMNVLIFLMLCFLLLFCLEKQLFDKVLKNIYIEYITIVIN